MKGIFMCFFPLKYFNISLLLSVPLPFFPTSYLFLVTWPRGKKH